MRFIQYKQTHFKNEQAFRRCCALFNIEYGFTNDFKEISNMNPDFIWSPEEWFEPSIFPNKKILYGPSLFVVPTESHGCVGNSLNLSNVYMNCLSEWVKELYSEFVTNTKVPFACLPFSVDTNKFCPQFNTKEYDCLVYFKNRHSSELSACLNILNSLNLSYNVVKYGSYQENDYINLLNKTKFCIWIGRHESQGFAFQECLSMNVPIFVWDVSTMKEERSNDIAMYTDYSQQLKATCVSYWDSRCGKMLNNKDNFKEEFISFMNGNYSPREFVLETLSDKVCFNRLLDLYNITNI